MKQVDSLRSNVSKNALIAVKELFDYMGPALDGELDNIMPGLFKKTVDSKFLRVESEEALMAAVNHASEE